MHTTTSTAVLVFFVATALVACAPDAPTIPLNSDPRLDSTGHPTVFPAIPRTGTAYDRVTPSSIPGTSRFVLYDDGTFDLQYLRPDFGFFAYAGKYARADSSITFLFNDAATAGPWVAAGILRGDSLVVKFNLVMILSDFEDGMYRSSGPLPGTARIQSRPHRF